MIKSMTGFGRCEAAENNRKFTVELKSVNHRYLDINIRMPKKFGFFENAIRALMKEYVQRGKVDMFISYEDAAEENFSVKYNEAVAGEYVKYLNKMTASFGLKGEIDVCALAGFPEVFTMEEQGIDEEEIWVVLEKALRGALDRFVESRKVEGESLARDLLAKLDAMSGYVDVIQERSPEILSEYRTRLSEKIKELLGDAQADEGRIAMEVTIFADKICVDEETVRLKSHIDAMKKALREGGSIGRKLDFIAQEMNREANTILSKTTDLKLSDIGIDLKTDIEKVREQIQNIE